MKVLKGSFQNFGSYKSLEFDFSNLGLALVFGKTGSGKSTIPDMVAWTITGQTAKNGSVDDVISWTADNEPTSGVLGIELNDGTVITVTRVRGSSKDLYWTEGESKPKRGKDLNDTQKLLEQRLGFNSEIYLTAAYFHEFSPTGLFFTASAKDRRAIFEKIANTELADSLNLKSRESKKVQTGLLDYTARNKDRAEARLKSTTKSLQDSRERSLEEDSRRQDLLREYEVKSLSFEKTKKEKIEALNLKSQSWENEQSKKIDQAIQKIEKLDSQIVDPKDLDKTIKELKKSSRCRECGQPKELEALNEAIQKSRDNDNLISKRSILEAGLKDLAENENPHLNSLEAAKAEVNNYAERAEEEKKKVNPFKAQVEGLEKELAEVTAECHKFGVEIVTLNAKISNLNALYDLSFELRGRLLKQAVQNAQDSANRYLEKYFDSEIKVQFELSDADDLEVKIQKSGYECNYRQLSRGQRSLLRLCFVITVMQAAANKAGTHFDNLYLDEVLDGMDADLKLKAYPLLEELSLNHSSVMVIDHDQGFQNMFSNKFEVTMEADYSRIEELS